MDGAPNIRCPVTFVATSKVHLLIINSKTFHQIISDFPIVLQLMNKYRPTVSLVRYTMAFTKMYY